MSVGDIINIDNIRYICTSIGFRKMNQKGNYYDKEIGQKLLVAMQYTSICNGINVKKY